MTSAVPGFDQRVPPGGYAWWYLDALSDDGTHGLTLIAFIGSVFSPYYAAARRRGAGEADPLNHCALNIALYARPGSGAPTAWAMTERGARALDRSPQALRIGPSALEWNGRGLTIRIDEVAAPWPMRIRGTVRVRTAALLGTSYPLDAAGLHRWTPLAPSARVDVDLERPGLRWQGQGYLDANAGARALERDFLRWDWSRAMRRDGGAAVVYDVARTDGGHTGLALAFDGRGGAHALAPPPAVALGATRWRLPRGTRSDAGAPASVIQTLEDGPFYARSLVEVQWLGERATAMHESLCLRRFSARWVQCLLPFRMPRRAG